MRAVVTPEDVVQEVWARAIPKFGEFDPDKGEFRGWIFGFAKRVLKQLLRQKERREIQPGVQTGELCLTSLPADITSVTRRVTRSEEFRFLIDLSRTLDPVDQEILLQRGLQGQAHDAIASSLSISPASCRKRWERLRVVLREHGVSSRILAAEA
jgi:RNA polymerase sigma-70 factor (ECF subfamily)